MVVASGDVRLRFHRREAGAEVDRLYRRHADEVLRYAQLVLRSRADAEDITQTVFVRALRAIERGEKVRTPRNWLIKIAHNECRRLLSTRKVHAELPDEIAVEPIEHGRAEELRGAMAALPATQRGALVMRELEGRSYAEIAKSLDLSVSAVETLIFRARRSLREQIENAMSCEEFVALLEDPSARARVRAHARVCADCATLDHQYRGRKSALKRIASALGLPGWGTWWGAKVAAVALTTAGVAVVAVPHDFAPSETKVKPIPLTQPKNLVTPGSGIRKTQALARPVATAPKKKVSGTAAVSGTTAAPGMKFVAAPMDDPPSVAIAVPPAPPPDPKPNPPLPPAAAEPVAVPRVAVPPVTVGVPPTALPDPKTALTDPQSALPPVPATPTVTLPTTSVAASPPELPAVTIPVEPPKVKLP